MKTNEITEGNKLIAEFMGWWFDIDNNRKYLHFLSNGEFEYLKSENDLLFNSSWDWLMPVIQKIFTMPFAENEGLERYIEDNLSAYSFGFHCPIDMVFNKIIDLITWYNKTH